MSHNEVEFTEWVATHSAYILALSVQKFEKIQKVQENNYDIAKTCGKNGSY